VGTGTTFLIDFGSTREYSKSFVDGYLRIVWACANGDTKTLMDQSHEMGFLTGDENSIMREAHKLSGFTLGEPFATDEAYNFKNSGITKRLQEHGSAFLQHRLTPPPEEVYTLHRKLAGAFNLCIKLGADIKCRDLLEDVMKNHVFEDGKPHPMEQ
jgi:aarF domain-containing kinase